MKSKAISPLAYTAGFIWSLTFTLAAYFAITTEFITGRAAVIFIVVLAVAQLWAQLVFFLHLGRESKPKLNLLIFCFMLIVVGILVIGSLWIMHNLDYNMMPHDMDQEMMQEEGIYR